MLISSVLSICFVVAAQDSGDQPKDRLLAIPPGTSLGSPKTIPTPPDLAAAQKRAMPPPQSDNPFDFVGQSEPQPDQPPSRIILPPSEFRDAEVSGPGRRDISHRTPQWCREVIEAKRVADKWAFYKTINLGPQNTKELILKRAAYQQIIEAYDLTPQEFNAIVADRRLARQPFRRVTTPSGDAHSGIHFSTGPWGDNKTLFDPDKVMISRRPQPSNRAKPPLPPRAVRR